MLSHASPAKLAFLSESYVLGAIFFRKKNSFKK